MYLITKPTLAKGVKIKVTITNPDGPMRTVSADLGALAEWVCIVNHDGPLPPAGLGMMASAGGVPHIHTYYGTQVLEDGWWLVIMDDEPHVYTDAEVQQHFTQATDETFSPTYQRKHEWMKYRGTVDVTPTRKELPRPRNTTMAT